MSSLIEELQFDLTNHKLKLSTILGKALLVASKLDVDDIQEWLKLEIYGYIDEKNNVPDYRMLYGRPQGYDRRTGDWLDINMKGFPKGLDLKKFIMPNPISDLETDLENIDNEMLLLEYPEDINEQLCKLIDTDRTGFIFTKTQFSSIINHVRNKLIEWTIKLEKSGVYGIENRFTDEDISKAKTVIINIYQGNVNDSQINNSSSNSNQNIN